MARTISTIYQKSIWNRQKTDGTDDNGKTDYPTEVQKKKLKRLSVGVYTNRMKPQWENFAEKSEPNKQQIITVYQEQYTPTKNSFCSHGERVFGLKKPSETPEKHWKELCEL